MRGPRSVCTRVIRGTFFFGWSFYILRYSAVHIVIRFIPRPPPLIWHQRWSPKPTELSFAYSVGHHMFLKKLYHIPGTKYQAICHCIIQNVSCFLFTPSSEGKSRSASSYVPLDGEEFNFAAARIVRVKLNVTSHSSHTRFPKIDFVRASLLCFSHTYVRFPISLLFISWEINMVIQKYFISPPTSFFSCEINTRFYTSYTLSPISLLSFLPKCLVLQNNFCFRSHLRFLFPIFCNAIICVTWKLWIIASPTKINFFFYPSTSRQRRRWWRGRLFVRVFIGRRGRQHRRRRLRVRHFRGHVDHVLGTRCILLKFSFWV